jgi:hypothetical protein
MSSATLMMFAHILAASVEFECTSSNCVMTTTTSHIHTDKYEPVRAEITTCKIQKDLSFACVAIFSGQLTWDIPPEGTAAQLS